MRAAIGNCMMYETSRARYQRDHTHVIWPLDRSLTAIPNAITEEECLAGHPSRASLFTAPLVSLTCVDRVASIEGACRCPLIHGFGMGTHAAAIPAQYFEKQD